MGHYGFNYLSTNNGNVVSWSATGNQTFNRTYSYDSLNRLSTMSSPSDPSGCNGLSWTYDPWGNRTDQNLTAGACSVFHASVNTQNQLVDPVNNVYRYDAAGNLINDGSHTYTYDAEGLMIQVDGGSTATYVYDAFGRRVKKTVVGYPTEYMYTLDGQIDSMMEGSAGHLTRGFVYLNGLPLVEYANGTTYFVHTDHLGSARLLTNYPTPTIAESDDYYPFGKFNSSGSTSALKFTADERDSETTLDDTLFRQYSSSFGRWTIPDPAGFLAADASNPQSWNGYAYVQNNPLAFTDPLGLFTCGSIQVSCDTPPDPLAGLDLCFFGFCGGNGSELPLIYRGGHGGGGNSGGPDVNKTWSKTFGCKANAQQLMSSVQNNMAQFADNRNTIFAANFPSQPIQLGGQYVIQPGLNPHTSDGCTSHRHSRRNCDLTISQWMDIYDGSIATLFRWHGLVLGHQRR